MREARAHTLKTNTHCLPSIRCRLSFRTHSFIYYSFVGLRVYWLRTAQRPRYGRRRAEMMEWRGADTIALWTIVTSFNLPLSSDKCISSLTAHHSTHTHTPFVPNALGCDPRLLHRHDEPEASNRRPHEIMAASMENTRDQREISLGWCPRCQYHYY